MTTALPSAFQEGSSNLAALQGHAPLLPQENKFFLKDIRNRKAEGDWTWRGEDAAECCGKLSAMPQTPL